MRSTDTAHTSVLPDVQPTAVCSLSSIRAEPGRGYWFGIGSTGVAALLTLVSAQVQTDRCRNQQVTSPHVSLLLMGRPHPAGETSLDQHQNQHLVLLDYIYVEVNLCFYDLC